jgi:hypothetical protein
VIGCGETDDVEKSGGVNSNIVMSVNPVEGNDSGRQNVPPRHSNSGGI